MYEKETAVAIGVVEEKIIEKKGEKVVLVSLARAGIPVGILIKHYLFFKYKIVKINLFVYKIYFSLYKI